MAPPLFILGLILFVLDISGILFFKNYFFEKVIFHSLAPFSFFLMIFGAYYYDFSKWKVIRFVAYYSYNWYLWHPLFVWIVGKYFGISIFGLVIYMVVSFSMAMVFTILVEEKFLSIRESVLSRIFKKNKI